MHKLTVDQALALVEQERLDELAAVEPGEEFYECASYVLASEIRRIRAAAPEERSTEGRSRHELILDVVNLRKALYDISKGQGAFSRDPMEHAINTIADMKAIAAAALDGTYMNDDGK